MTRQKFIERKFSLTDERQRANALALIPNLPLDAAKPLEVVIREQVKARKPDQNALMWAGPLRDIAEQAWLDGKQFSAEAWAYFFKREFLPDNADPESCDGTVKDGYLKWDFTPDGERILTGSSTQLTVRGFSLYLEQMHAFGSNLGVRFSAPQQGK